MKFLRTVLAACITCTILYPVNASHISGGEITYQCLGSDLYEVTLSLYRHCDGIGMPSSENLDFNGTCGIFTRMFPLLNPGGTEVSQLCASELPNSTCNGGLLPGTEVYHYSDTVTLLPCDPWVISYEICCRNASVSNLANPGANDMYIEATLNNVDHPCNNSPLLTTHPAPLVCIGQTTSFNIGAVDRECDTLSYSLISARKDQGVPIAYNPGFSPTQPIPGTTLDPVSGNITFTPTTAGTYVFVVRVDQLDASGDLIGTVLRDFHVVAYPCTNSQPAVGGVVITNVTGSGVIQVDSTSIQLCQGGSFCFDIEVSDPDVADQLSLVSNIDQLLPGATLSLSGTNPVVGTFCGTTPPGYSGHHHFTVMASDTACPVPGTQYYGFDLYITSATTAGSNQAICGSQTSTQLQAFGGTVFNWSALPGGDPIVVGQNFSCNPCDSPIASPSVTTSYVVTSNLSGGCTNVDTVTVAVVASFNLNLTLSDTLVCLDVPPYGAVQAEAMVPNPAGYTYSWSPAHLFNDPTIADPVLQLSQVGTEPIHVTVTSPDGCVQIDSAEVTGYICGGGGVCASSPQACANTPTTVQVGNGQSVGTTTVFPSVYGNWYEGGKTQMLYRATDLYAQGVGAGMLTELGFYVDSVAGSSIYYEWDLRLGCTTLDEVNDTTWFQLPTTVYYADSIVIDTGWNMYSFPAGFQWDGISNLVVETCWNNDGHLSGFTNNSPTTYDDTPYNSVIWANQDNAPFLCDSGQVSGSSTKRPAIRFGWCDQFVGVGPDLPRHAVMELHPVPLRRGEQLIITGIGRNARIMVYSTDGRIVATPKMTGGDKRLTMDTAPLAPGTYLLQADGQVQRFVVSSY